MDIVPTLRAYPLTLRWPHAYAGLAGTAARYFDLRDPSRFLAHRSMIFDNFGAGSGGYRDQGRSRVVATLARDMTRASELYKPTNYWSVYRKRLEPAIAKHGISRFRSCMSRCS